MTPQEAEILRSVVEGLRQALTLLLAERTRANGTPVAAEQNLTETERIALEATGKDWRSADRIAVQIDPGATEASSQLRALLNLLVERGLLESATGKGYRRN